MTEHMAKLIDVVGTSTESLEKAVEHAVAEISKTVPGVRWFQMTELRGHVKDGKVERYQAILRIGSVEEDK